MNENGEEDKTKSWNHEEVPFYQNSAPTNRQIPCNQFSILLKLQNHLVWKAIKFINMGLQFRWPNTLVHRPTWTTIHSLHPLRRTNDHSVGYSINPCKYLSLLKDLMQLQQLLHWSIWWSRKFEQKGWLLRALDALMKKEAIVIFTQI